MQIPGSMGAGTIAYPHAVTRVDESYRTRRDPAPDVSPIVGILVWDYT